MYRMKALKSQILNGPYGWAVLIVFALWFLINNGSVIKFLEVFERKEKNRIEKLEVYISSNKDSSNDKTLDVIKDFRDIHYFKMATGIYAEKKFRDSLIGLYESTPNMVTWVTIRRALPYIEITNAKIAIRDMNKFDKIGTLYNNFMGGAVLLLAISIFLSLLSLPQPTFYTVFLVLFVGLIFISIALLMFSQNWPKTSAKTIKEELSKLEKDIE